MQISSSTELQVALSEFKSNLGHEGEVQLGTLNRGKGDGEWHFVPIDPSVGADGKLSSEALEFIQQLQADNLVALSKEGQLFGSDKKLPELSNIKSVVIDEPHRASHVFAKSVGEASLRRVTIRQVSAFDSAAYAKLQGVALKVLNEISQEKRERDPAELGQYRWTVQTGEGKHRHPGFPNSKGALTELARYERQGYEKLATKRQDERDHQVETDKVRHEKEKRAQSDAKYHKFEKIEDNKKMVLEESIAFQRDRQGK